ncbi:MAG: septum formation protein Maf [Crocinitomix sp. MedPE-SWsnd]|nr:MAG: septum formation protein Maf [Crocinitomix sp. MedPE-SWsnd]
MLENLANKRIILSSKSPRRQELLKGLDIDFEIEVRPVDEIYSLDLEAEKVPSFLSKLKATAFDGDLNESDILITSDTIVILGSEILEKPKSEEEAKGMIRKMAGKTHTVVTGVALTSADKQEVFSDHTKVTFGELTDEEIEYYISKYKPFDKAGSYGVQEWIGYVAIDNLEGSYYNVMGLPLHKLYKALKHF